MSSRKDVRLDGQNDRFIEAYRKYKNSPFRVLLALYHGQYYKFLISSFFYLIKIFIQSFLTHTNIFGCILQTHLFLG